ncbi:DoxX family protein [Alcaligenes faecalis]|uniref:DoxX family protein n=1 Tax=Alcaligenes faecalis TaxID=511 RepID=UPI001292D25E|nr:DoxX family protein [Alcaligenes faecalis]MBX6965958.1 DoxX family protein [Providencia rettgeri]MBX7031239.1 DoxX family protein [Alcaligenes faecalis]QFY77409.1 DoxX family protein [Alcaligenes faecalis]
MNHVIQELLRSRVYFVLATLLLTYIFWWSGVNKVWDFSAAKREMAHFGLEPQALFAVLTIAVQLLGSWLIISASRLAWLGALMLGVFTLSTIPLAHRFWAMQGLEAFLEQALVQDHISVIGGLAVAAALAHAHRQARH